MPRDGDGKPDSKDFVAALIETLIGMSDSSTKASMKAATKGWGITAERARNQFPGSNPGVSRLYSPCMSDVLLSDVFLAKIAGWDVIKKARFLLEQGAVLSSNWTPPLLKGVVQEGPLSYRAGLVIKDTINLENICRCRPSQDWGTICAHSVAVGLHHLKRLEPANTSPARPRGDGSSGPTGYCAPQAAPRYQSSAARHRGGEPLEISVIVPPNFGPALARGKVMLCFEGQWRRGRGPLNALPMTLPFSLSKQDRALLFIETIAEGDTPGMLMLGSADLSRVLSQLIGHPRVTLGRSAALTVSDAAWRVPLRAALEKNGRDPPGAAAPPCPAPAHSGQTVLDLPRTRAVIRAYPAAERLRTGPGLPLRFERTQVPVFLSRDWPALADDAELEANFKLEDFSLEPHPPRFLLALAGGLAQLTAQLQCAYGPRIMTIGVTPRNEVLWLPDPTSPTRYSTRDLAAEQAAVGILARAGFFGPDAQGRYQMTGPEPGFELLCPNLPSAAAQWEVTLEERLERSTSQNLEWISPGSRSRPRANNGSTWMLPLHRGAANGFRLRKFNGWSWRARPHPSKNGRIALVDTGAVEELRKCSSTVRPNSTPASYRLKNNQAGYLDASLAPTIGLGSASARPLAGSGGAANGRSQAGSAATGRPRIGAPSLPKARCRLVMVSARERFGGILADEMGLGKTLQTLAYLRAARAQSRLERPRTGTAPFSGRVSNQPRLQLGSGSVQVHARPSVLALQARNGSSCLIALPLPTRHHQLRFAPARRGPLQDARIRHRDPGRSPAHQEPPNPKRPGGQSRPG